MSVCDVCGADVRQTLFRSVVDEKHWLTDHHGAPCGLECIGAGVSGKNYRLGHYHGRKSCALCDGG